MAFAQATLRLRHGRAEDDGLAAAERAMALDPKLAEPHAIKARILAENGRADEAEAEVQTALALDAESVEVNEAAAYQRYRQRRFAEAIPYYERAANAPEAPIGISGMLMSCYAAIGDEAGRARTARMSLERAQAALAKDPNNTDALGFGACAHAVLGDADSARAWVRRAMLIDPDNRVARYNLACALAADIGDRDGALDLLAPYFATATAAELAHMRADPDLDGLRDDARYIALLAEAEARVGKPT